MNKLYFCNKGYFNIKAMMTFGVSAKEKDDAIGFFGTGFKYAVAIVLRDGGKIKIFTDGEEYVFTAKTEEIRGKSFQIVYMNDKEAGFTTDLGRNWEPWMAFRELYCNCMDENGSVSEKTMDMDTVIEVESDNIYMAYLNKNLYFIDGEPLDFSAGTEIYPTSRPYVFYKGVAVFPCKAGIYTYNIKTPIDLTEDRTAKNEYQISFALKRCIQNMENKVMLKKALTAHYETLEGGIGFDKDFGVSKTYIETCRELLAAGIAIKDSAHKYLKSIDEKNGNWPELALTNVQNAMLEKAKEFLRKLDITIDKYPIKVVEGLGDDVMGRAMEDTIYLSMIPFDLGTKQVASTLLEEWVHNHHGCADFDRRMQSWLFDKILSIGEEINGEPL